MWGAGATGIQPDGRCVGSCIGTCESVAPGASCNGICAGACEGGSCDGTAAEPARCDGACDVTMSGGICEGMASGGCDVGEVCSFACDVAGYAHASCRGREAVVGVLSAADPVGAYTLASTIERYAPSMIESYAMAQLVVALDETQFPEAIVTGEDEDFADPSDSSTAASCSSALVERYANARDDFHRTGVALGVAIVSMRE